MAQLDRSLIAAAPTFAGLDSDALDEILAQASPLRLPKGEAAFRQGETAEHFFLLLHGRLGVTRLNPQGQQMVVRFIAPGG
jgi:CRP/FNR family transcriptional regulator, nitrogen oxide reductase regulator